MKFGRAPSLMISLYNPSIAADTEIPCSFKIASAFSLTKGLTLTKTFAFYFPKKSPH